MTPHATKPPTVPDPATKQVEYPPKPPRRPPTAAATGTGATGGAAFGVVVPIPPGWKMGPLEVVSGFGPTYYRRGLTADDGNFAKASATVPAQATAAAIEDAWVRFLGDCPGGIVAAAAAGCRVPQPEPAAGMIHTGEAVTARVLFSCPLTLTATPELVRLDVRELATPPDGIDAARRRSFVHGEPMHATLTFNLEAVAQDWDGKLRPAAELTDPTPPEPRGNQSMPGTRPAWSPRLAREFHGLVAFETVTGPGVPCRFATTPAGEFGPPPLTLDSTQYPAV